MIDFSHEQGFWFWTKTLNGNGCVDTVLEPFLLGIFTGNELNASPLFVFQL